MTEVLIAIQHPLLAIEGIKHGFFTRNGGVSEAPYDSLNVGIGSKDDPQSIHENRRRVAAYFGQLPDDLLSLYQIHSNIAHVVEAPWANNEARPQADGMVSTTPNLILSALSADCAPLLFCDPEAMVIGACHAGWKGALYGMIEATIAQMCAKGAARNRIRCVVGPCIAQASYEVSDTYEAEFLAHDPESAAYFIMGNAPDKRFFDLPGYCLSRLERAGLSHIAATGHDTCAQNDLFFSNRRAFKQGEPDYGRLISAIMII
jgi:hypothetical protein